MAEPDRFPDFRSGVAAPGEDARRRAAARLQGAIEGKHRHGRVTMLLVRRRPGRTALALAALATAVGTALFVSTSWKTSPGFLERAQAALTPPAGTILHMRWESGLGSIDPACTITRGPGLHRVARGAPPSAVGPPGAGEIRVVSPWIARGPHEAWIDQTPPHRFRMIKAWPNGSGEARTRGCDTQRDGRRPRLGNGALLCGAEHACDLARWAPGGRPPDPVTELRQAISAGRAHLEGRTQLDGHTLRTHPHRCPIRMLRSQRRLRELRLRRPRNLQPRQNRAPRDHRPLPDIRVPTPNRRQRRARKHRNTTPAGDPVAWLRANVP